MHSSSRKHHLSVEIDGMYVETFVWTNFSTNTPSVAMDSFFNEKYFKDDDDNYYLVHRVSRVRYIRPVILEGGLS